MHVIVLLALELIVTLQILSFNGDNATSNDKQTIYLDKLPNTFKAVN